MKALSDVASWATVSTVTISDPFGPGLFELPLQTLANRDYYLSAQVVSIASAVGVGADASSAVQSVETVLSSEVASIDLAIDIVDSTYSSAVDSVDSAYSAGDSAVVLAVESGYNSGDTSVLAVASGYTSTAEATLESGYQSADTSLTSRLSSEESTRTSEIASVAALAGGGLDIYHKAFAVGSDYALESTLTLVTDGTTSLTITPAAGTYLVLASGVLDFSSGDGLVIKVQKDTTDIWTSAAWGWPAYDNYGVEEIPWAINQVVTVNGSQSINIKGQWTTSSGGYFRNGALTLIPLSSVT